MSHRLAVVTVVYNNYNILEDFFASFKTQTNKNFTIFVVDLTESVSVSPGVADSPSEALAKRGWAPQGWESHIKILNGPNKGYAFGLNLGLKQAIKDNFELFCFINSDTVVHKEFVNTFINQLMKVPGSIVGGKIYYYPGYEYHKQRYKKEHLGKVLWYAGGRVDWNNVITSHRGVDEVDRRQYNKFEKTDFITACLMGFDKSVIDTVGYLDESYFLYYEDADWCSRARRAGITLYYDPDIIIWHKNAQSTGGAGSSLHQKYQERNRMKFGLKYAPWRTKIHLIKNYIFPQ